VIRDHRKAVLELLRADPLLQDSTQDGTAGTTKLAGPYCVVYSNQGSRETERLLATQTRANFDYTIHSIGHDVESAQLVAERVYARLLGVKPTIAGRSCWPISSEVSQPVRLDSDTSPALFYGVDVFRLSSTPA
jgi:hypothetical protein